MRNKIKFRIVIFAVMLMLFCLGFAGCASCENDNPPNGTIPDGEKPAEENKERKAGGGIEYLFTHYEGYAYSAPAVLVSDDGKILTGYTTNASKNSDGNIIAVRTGTRGQDGKFAFGEQTAAISASADSWDKYNIGNCDITAGEFKLGGEDYKYLMAYEASAVSAEKRFQIGLAVSKDGVTWVKAYSAPFVSYNYEIYGDTAGVRYPSLINLNGKGDVMLFYSYADSLITETRFVEAKLGNLDNVIASGDIAVPNKGLPLDGNEWGVTVNADFGYDIETEEIFVVKDGFPYASQNDKKATKIEIAKISRSDLYMQDAQWSTVCAVIDGIDAGGYTRIHSADFVSDEFGGINSQRLEVLFTSGVAQKNAQDESWKFLGGIHYFQVPDSLRGDK